LDNITSFTKYQPPVKTTATMDSRIIAVLKMKPYGGEDVFVSINYADGVNVLTRNRTATVFLVFLLIVGLILF